MTQQLVSNKQAIGRYDLRRTRRTPSNPNGADDSIIKDQIGYVCQPGLNRISIFDLSIPPQSVVLDNLTSGTNLDRVTNVAVSDDGATMFAVGHDSGIFSSWDITDKTNPVFLDLNVVGADFRDIKFITIDDVDYIVTVSDDPSNNIAIWDVSNPSSITLIDTLVLNSDPIKFDFYQPNLAVISQSGADSLLLVDLSTPATLVLLDTHTNALVNNPRFCLTWFADNGEQYIAWAGRDLNATPSVALEILQVVNDLFVSVSTLENLAFEATFSLALIGTHLLVGISRANKDIYTVDVFDPSSPFYVSSQPIYNFAILRSTVINDPVARVAAFAAIPAGTAAFNITLGNTNKDVLGIDYSSVTTLGGDNPTTSVNGVTQAAIAAAFPNTSIEVKDDSTPDQFLFINDIMDGSSNISFLGSPSSGFDVSGAVYLTADAANGTLAKRWEAIENGFAIHSMETWLFLSIQDLYYFYEVEMANLSVPAANVTSLHVNELKVAANPTTFTQEAGATGIQSRHTGVLEMNVGLLPNTATSILVGKGTGIIVDTSFPDHIRHTMVEWIDQVYTIQNIGVTGTNVIFVDKNGIIGEFVFFDETPDDKRDKILIGSVSNAIPNVITEIDDVPQRTAYENQTWNDYYDIAIEAVKRGCDVTSASLLTLDVGKGSLYLPNINYLNNKKSPDILDFVAVSGISFFRIRRQVDPVNGVISDGPGTPFTSINPGQFDDGSGTLAVVGNAEWTIQHLYVTRNLLFLVSYGQQKFASQAAAVAEAPLLAVAEKSPVSTFFFLGQIIVKGNETDITVGGQILKAPPFRTQDWKFIVP